MSDHPEDRHEVESVAPRHPVVKAAAGEEEIHTLSTGVRVRLRPVAPSLIAEISASVEYPTVPRIVDESGREMENPMHPDYIRNIEAADNKRATRVLEAIVMFAFELVDGMPEDDEWLRSVQLLARRGAISLEGLDLKEPLDREFVYKKYIAVGNEDMQLAGSVAGIRGEEVEAASRSFPGT